VSSGDINTDIYNFKVEMLRRRPNDERLMYIDEAMNDMFIKNISEKVMSLDEIREYIDAHDQG
jgi:hypothetical protein